MPTMITIKDRTKKITNIKENLVNIPDDILTDVYKIINDAINKKKKEKDPVNRFEKVQYIKLNLEYVDNEGVAEIEDVMTHKEHEETESEKMLRVILEIANKLLETIKKPQIDNVCDFRMSRDDILSDECKNVINENKKYIFESGFNKSDCKIGQSGTKNKHFSLFKGMVGQIEGHSLQSKLKFKTHNYERESFTEYHIVRKDIEVV